MNGSREFVKKFFVELGDSLNSVPPAVSIALCPPFTLVPEVASHIQDTRVVLGAQDVSANVNTMIYTCFFGYIKQASRVWSIF